MEHLPFYVSASFVLMTGITLGLFYKASGYSRIVIGILLGWLGLQSLIGLTGFYTVTGNIPPRFLALIVPPLALIATLFITKAGRRFLDRLDIRTLTLLHTIRIGIEFVLLGLFVNKMIPQIMTFEGRNFDILSGITAPIVYYFVFVRKGISRSLLLIWNLLSLALLVNIVAIAILCAPGPQQRLAFEQPNTAILYFPFVWLPACVVPIVLFSLLASIRQLVNKTSRSIIVVHPAEVSLEHTPY